MTGIQILATVAYILFLIILAVLVYITKKKPEGSSGYQETKTQITKDFFNAAGDILLEAVFHKFSNNGNSNRRS